MQLVEEVVEVLQLHLDQQTLVVVPVVQVS
jgi:hypothetical protein